MLGGGGGGRGEKAQSVRCGVDTGRHKSSYNTGQQVHGSSRYRTAAGTGRQQQVQGGSSRYRAAAAGTGQQQVQAHRGVCGTALASVVAAIVLVVLEPQYLLIFYIVHFQMYLHIFFHF